MPTDTDIERHSSAATSPPFRYWAFISYSHRDERHAARLHRKIEGYVAHTRLSVSTTGSHEPLPKRIFPVFRDRDELAGAPDLSERIQEALRESRFLIVICSPHSAQSKWVNEEIKAFKRLGRENHVLAFIIDGEPNAGDHPGSAASECFPDALRYRIGPDGELTSERTEPLAADARSGQDGPGHAVVKLIAGILGVRFDDLRRRDQERATRRRNWITAGSLSAAAVFAGIAGFAYYQQTIAQERSRVALSRQLAAQAMNDVPGVAGSGVPDYARGLLLAAQGLATRSTVEARSTLLKVVLASPYRLRYLWGHTTSIAAVAASPDGKLFAAAAEDGTVRLWDAATFKPLEGSLPGLEGKVSRVAFSPRGDVLAAAGENATVQLWNVSMRQRLGPPLTGAPATLTSLAFSRDGTRLAAGGRGMRAGEVAVWNVATSAASASAPVSQPTGHSDAVAAIAFSPDGTMLLSVGLNGSMTVWDAAKIEPLKVLEGQPADCAAFSEDGKWVATGGHSGVGTRRTLPHPHPVVLWDLATGGATGIGAPPQIEDIRSVAFGAGNMLVAGGRDGRIFVWRDGNWDAMETIAGHKDAVTSMVLGPEAGTLVSGGADGSVIVRDLRDGAPLAVSIAEASSVAAAKNSPAYRNDTVALSTDGRTIAWESTRGKILLWDVPSGTVRRELGGNSNSITSIAFSPDGKAVAAGTPEDVVVWDVGSGNVVRPPVPSQAVAPRMFSHDGKFIVLRMPDQSVSLWDVPNRAVSGLPRRANTSALLDVAFSPAGDLFAAAGADGVVHLWEPATDTPRPPLLAGHQGTSGELGFSPDGTGLALVVYADDQSRVTLWDVGRAERRDLLTPRPMTIERIVFSPDSTTLAAGGRDGEVLLWNVATGGTSPAELFEHSGIVVGLAFSPEGDSLISIADGTAIVWDVRTRLAIGRISDTAGTRSVAFSADSRAMVSTPEWGPLLTLRDWDPESWARYACAAANRDLTRAEWDQFVGSESDYAPGCPQFEQAGRR